MLVLRNKLQRLSKHKSNTKPISYAFGLCVSLTLSPNTITLIVYPHIIFMVIGVDQKERAVASPKPAVLVATTSGAE